MFEIKNGVPSNFWVNESDFWAYFLAKACQECELENWILFTLQYNYKYLIVAVNETMLEQEIISNNTDYLSMAS